MVLVSRYIALLEGDVDYLTPPLVLLSFLSLEVEEISQRR